MTPDELAGKRTGERIQILRERKGLTRPVLAGLVGMSPSWLKGIERGTRLALPMLVRVAEALGVGDVAVLTGTDMDIGGSSSIPVRSFARVPHDAVPAIREAVRDPLLSIPDVAVDVTAPASRTTDAWHVWHTSREHRTDVLEKLAAELDVRGYGIRLVASQGRRPLTRTHARAAGSRLTARTSTPHILWPLTPSKRGT